MAEYLDKAGGDVSSRQNPGGAGRKSGYRGRKRFVRK